MTTSTILQDLADYSNQAAWERFAQRFRAPMVRFARQMGLGESDAEDAAQESLLAFAEAYRQGQYDPTKGRLSRWLFGIAFRQALGHRRAGVRRAHVTRQAEGTSFWANVEDDKSAADVWDQEWERAMLETCLRLVRQEVEPTTMRAFELLMQNGPPAEVAGQLGVPVKKVYNAKYTVLKRIRELRADLEDLV